jgi:hypothetical protein
MHPTPFDLLQNGLDRARRLLPGIDQALVAHGGIAARDVQRSPEPAWDTGPQSADERVRDPAGHATQLLCQGFTEIGNGWHDFLASWLADNEHSPWANLPTSTPAVFRRVAQRFGGRPELELHWRDFDGDFVTGELERLRGWCTRAAAVRVCSERFSDDSLARKRAQLRHAIGFMDDVGRQLDALLQTARLLATMRR